MTLSLSLAALPRYVAGEELSLRADGRRLPAPQSVESRGGGTKGNFDPQSLAIERTAPVHLVDEEVPWFRRAYCSGERPAPAQGAEIRAPRGSNRMTCVSSPQKLRWPVLPTVIGVAWMVNE